MPCACSFLGPAEHAPPRHPHGQHFTGGLSLSGVDLRRAASKEEFVAAVAAAAEKLGSEEWVLGGFWDGESSDPI